MTTRIVLEETGFGIRAAVLVDDRLIEIRDSDRDDPPVTEALFAARVTAVDTKLNAAFLDCGLPQPALLVAKDARAAAGIAERLPIRATGARGPAADRAGRARGRGRQGRRGSPATSSCSATRSVYSPVARCVEPAQQPGRRQGEAAARARAGAVPRWAGSPCAATRPSLPDEALLRARPALLAERWRRLEAAAEAARPGRLPQAESPLRAAAARAGRARRRGSIEVADRALAAGAGAAAGDAADTLPPIELMRLDPDEPAFAQTEVDAALERGAGAARCRWPAAAGC